MSALRTVAIAGAIGGSLMACGGEDVNSSARDLVDEICDLTFRCCSRSEVDLLFGPFVDQDSCADRLANSASLAAYALIALPFEGAAVAVPNLAVLERAVDDGRASLDEDALAACLDHLAAIECNQPVEVEPEMGCQPPPPVLPGACDLDVLVIGQVEAGGDCSSPGFSLECVDGLTCRAVDSLGVDGVCVDPGEVGAYCFADGECHEDLYCSALDGTCQVPRGEGEVCAYADPEDPSPSPSTLLIECAEELSCDPVTDRCVAPCQLGATCAGDEQCDEEAGLSCILGRCDRPRPAGLPCSSETDCQEGLRCALDPANPDRAICQARLPDGEPCSTFQPDECASGFCDPATAECAPASAPGGLCPSAQHNQCDEGYCETGYIFCSSDGQCPGSGTCNTAEGRCEYYCIALQPDGATCDVGYECASGSCIDDFCRTVPLADGQPCTFDGECASGFCGLDAARVCQSLPLPNGSTCTIAEQCESGVCHEAQCKTGLGLGDDCSSPFDPPCGRDLFCDVSGEAPVCAEVRGPGEPCDGSFQCHGECTIRYGRRMCDQTVSEDEALCDGQ